MASAEVDPSSASVVSVQHFCLHDGPGVRSLVFFKGCPLRCSWCQNPECWRSEPELGYKRHLCLGCGACVDACPEGALTAPGERDPLRCRLCFDCVAACPSGALTRFGEPQTVASLMAELAPEIPYYAASGGGVTLSGGEPTLVAAFAGRLVAALRTEGVHVAIETCGQLDPVAEPVAALLAAVDLVLFDLKLWDDDAHRAHCGVGNGRIKQNLRALAKRAAAGTGPALWARLPLVPTLTDSAENLRGWAGLLRELGIDRLTLVPYHRMGESKRPWLGLPPGVAVTPAADAVERARRVLADAGISACAPGEEPFGGSG